MVIVTVKRDGTFDPRGDVLQDIAERMRVALGDYRCSVHCKEPNVRLEWGPDGKVCASIEACCDDCESKVDNFVNSVSFG